MPDFDDELTRRLQDLASTAGDHAQRMPVAQLRRMGGRRHRRRVVTMVASFSFLAAAGAGGAVAAVDRITRPPDNEKAAEAPATTPQETSSRTEQAPTTPRGTDDDPTRPVTINPSVDNDVIPAGWHTEVPDDFPLADGLSSAATLDGPAEALGPLDTVTVCGSPVYPPEGTVDDLGVAWTSGEQTQQRDLTLYADANAAHAALERVVTAYDECDRETVAVGEYQVNEPENTTAGDEAFLVRQRPELEPRGQAPVQLTQLHIARVGNALLVLRDTRAATLGATSEEHSVQAVGATVEALAEEMCIFAARPCGVDTGGGSLGGGDGDGGEGGGPNPPPAKPTFDPQVALLTVGDLNRSYWSPFGGNPVTVPETRCSLPAWGTQSAASYTAESAAADAKVLTTTDLAAVTSTLSSCPGEELNHVGGAADGGAAQAWLYDHGESGDAGARQYELLLAGSVQGGPVQVLQIRYLAQDTPTTGDLNEIAQILLTRMASAG
ncbi:MAG: hypothetical protein GEU93_03665 [Propionibacteriales bacterium]|nr:hypothetical protein [Propionibacteriales bacterium]